MPTYPCSPVRCQCLQPRPQAALASCRLWGGARGQQARQQWETKLQESPSRVRAGQRQPALRKFSSASKFCMQTSQLEGTGHRDPPVQGHAQEHDPRPPRCGLARQGCGVLSEVSHSAPCRCSYLDGMRSTCLSLIHTVINNYCKNRHAVGLMARGYIYLAAIYTDTHTLTCQEPAHAHTPHNACFGWYPCTHTPPPRCRLMCPLAVYG